ncbi:kinase-like protein, partial [Calocera viscosa TUFC12733]
MFPACEERIDKKYGKWGRVLGKGTGGTVRLIQGPPRSGGKVFAVKEFRKKKGKETDFEYRRMITTECCFANGLKHVNVIETVDIVRNKSRYFQVMEYAPYDLFSVVMSGRMVQPEIYCVFRQICDGVAYLHSTGLAHRDLKLENCVMTNGNVVKLIDFGTATPSYHPDKGVILSSGLVGSDPYVAPEVIRGEMYDARRADVWSLGIIFLSMMLRRFPWALADPRKDLNYRKFASTLHELPRPQSPRK